MLAKYTYALIFVVFYHFIKMSEYDFFFEFFIYTFTTFDFMKYPRISYACTPYHESIAFCDFINFFSVLCVDIAICNHRNFHARFSAGNGFIIGFSAIKLFSCASMNTYKIHPQAFTNFSHFFRIFFIKS